MNPFDRNLQACQVSRELLEPRSKRNLLALRFAMLMEKRGASAVIDYLEPPECRLDESK